MTKQRAKEVIALAQAKTRPDGSLRFGPWVDRIEEHLAPGEDAEIKAVWDTMPGHTCYVDALMRIAKGKA